MRDRQCASSQAYDLSTHSRKKNAPYLYDLVITHALDWPTLTCQWFPDKESCVMTFSSRVLCAQTIT